MRLYTGRVEEIYVYSGEQATARLACPVQATPAPGQYLLAWQDSSILATPVFLGGSAHNGLLAAPPVPADWVPGARLRLRGPLGRGFRLPASARNLALVALGDTAARLLPLASSAQAQAAAVALFCDTPLPPLPSFLEAAPLVAFAEALSWADFLALDLPLPALSTWRESLGITGRLPCPAQALIWTPMPCGGLAECGVCATPARRAWKLACREGPVFDLNELVN